MVSFRFRSQVVSRLRRPVPSVPDSSVPDSGPISASDASAVDEARHPGWHSSSLELRRGLVVIEDVPMDEWPPELAARFNVK